MGSPETIAARADARAFTTRNGRRIELTTLGLGGAPLGNFGRILAEADVADIMAAAWTAGVRYFDTAPLYGHGLAEQRMGRFLAGQPRDSFVISTKVGRLLEACQPGEEESGIFLATPPLRIAFDYSYDGVMRSLEESFRRLGLDRVDIVLVHDVDARTHGGAAASEARIDELMRLGGWRALEGLRASGAVVAIGAGVNEAAPCVRLLEVADPDLFLLAGRYTLLEQEPLHSLFPACARRGVKVVIGGPYNSGVLARQGGSFDYARAPAEVTRKVARLEAVCARLGASLKAAALQFVAAHPVVASVIPGALSAEEVRANVALMRAPFPAQVWSELKAEGLIDAAAPVPGAEVAIPC